MMYFVVILFLFGGCLLSLMLREAFSNNVVVHHFLSPDYPKKMDPISIFFISDIHRRSISDRVVLAVKGKADFVVIGGDLTEKGVPYERIKENLGKLLTIGPVYFVWGNNDFEADENKLSSMLTDLGITLLDNKAVSLRDDGHENLHLIGVDDLNQNRDRLDLALEKTENSGFKIVVSHYPNIVDKILPEHHINLVLSGHTHGGQIHLLGYSPYKRGGLEKVGSTLLLISNGYGTTGIPLRLGAPAECHLLTIQNGQVSP
ncbi:metallophosphoesterase [Neobacillus dielmonensis]|uniref:metallophosphoesterase n=1 Tax=Neobacillus dielmonensis TaxID=1347369 RepID=UPI0005A6B436|nr:metallophosphoesterase [Neobacillus dielmonensis]